MNKKLKQKGLEKMTNENKKTLPKYDPKEYNSWAAWYLEYSAKLMKL